ncbi:MAG: extracellular solute-binding protein [Lachnospiraceae bacterium]|nr:extracellular solute-binding protein [Lachnospiraceae bacterium]
MKRKGSAVILLSLVLLFLYLPILILVIYSFTKSTTIGAIRGFSLQNYKTLFTTAELRDMILGNIFLALGVSMLSTILGTSGALGLFYGKRGLRKSMDVVNQIPVINADVVTGFSVCVLLIVFFRLDKDTYIPLVLGLTSLCTPFVYLSVTPRLKQMDPNLFEAALDLGCTPFRAIGKVVLPELLPGILSGFMTSVTLTLDDYFITTYTKPAVFNTISTYVVNATKGSRTEIKTALWALSTVIFFAVVLGVVSINMFPGGVDNIGKKGNGRHALHKRTAQKTGSGVRSILLFCALAGSLMFLCTGCGKEEDTSLVLRIANCEEYIDEGDWDEDEEIELADGQKILGENKLADDFCAWYEEVYGEPVRVEYSTYGTNEDLYNQLVLGNTFDLVCPSEYMILKFMEEKKLEPYSEDFFDKEKENNFYAKGVSPYISSVFKELSMNGEPVEKYGAGYMWGTMGIVYNPEYVKGSELVHWDALMNPKFAKRVTMKDGVRDSYFIALGILNAKEIQSEKFRNAPDYAKKLSEVMNDTSQETVDRAEDILSDMRKNAYSLETDSGKADMITGKVVANMQWSGDAVYTLDQAEEDGVKLSYAVPKECSNLWFDGWCMLKKGLSEDARKKQAAEAFVNFISRPDNVVRNMYYIGYTSAISGGEDDTVLEFLDYCYGAEEEEDSVEYPLGYFFGADSAEEEKKYSLRVEKEQLDRQLFAQYPPEDVIGRCAVMKCFSKEANQRISRMWINIRCFDLGW